MLYTSKFYEKRRSLFSLIVGQANKHLKEKLHLIVFAYDNNK